MENPDNSNQWNESLSQEFIDYGRYFVPERERQMEIIVELLPRLDSDSTVIELCCGEGLLAEAILTCHPNVTVHGLDGSAEMLRAAQKRLTSFNDRFQPRQFDLADHTWRTDFSAVDAEGNPVTEFDDFVQITLQFDPADLNGLDPVIHYYDGESWVALQPPAQFVDYDNNTVTGFSKHFSWFGILGIPEPSTILLFGAGLIGILVLARRKLKKK